MKNNNYDIISTAYHEAGHVIYALIKRCMVNYVKISKNRSRNVAGLTEYYSYLQFCNDLDIRRHFAFSEAGIHYSGLTAEKILYKKISGLNAFPPSLKDGSYVDNIHAANILKNNKKLLLTKKEIIADTYFYIENNWNGVESIAHYLLKNNKASYEDLKIILPFKEWKSIFRQLDFLYSQSLPEKNIKKFLLDKKII